MKKVGREARGGKSEEVGITLLLDVSVSVILSVRSESKDLCPDAGSRVEILRLASLAQDDNDFNQQTSKRLSDHVDQPAAPQTRRPLVLAALVLAMFLAAIEGTIVATAMPNIAAKLGGFSLYGWVFSSYLLMQAVMTPIFGKLSDLFGRKPVFIAGVITFLIGSALCGMAQSMEWLIAFRFLQGAGAGAVLPISSTLAGDLYTLEERGRIQGYLASVWGVSSIAGPLVGGLIVENADWHWIFWLNIPFGIIAIVMITLFLHERVEHRERSIDFAGAGLLLVGLSALMLALTQGADWGMRAVAALAVLSVLTMFVFVRHEKRVQEPLMHLELWNNRFIRLGNIAVLVMGVAMLYTSPSPR